MEEGSEGPHEASWVSDGELNRLQFEQVTIYETSDNPETTTLILMTIKNTQFIFYF